MSDHYKPERFGAKLKKLRTDHGISLKDLANRMGYVSHSYISEIENGKKQPTVELALKVSKFFDVSLDRLLKDDLNLD